MSPTVALISHSHPPAATEAVAIAAEAAREAGWRLVATGDEIAKHEAAASGIEEADLTGAEPDLCLVLGGDGSLLYALRKFAGRGSPSSASTTGPSAF